MYVGSVLWGPTVKKVITNSSIESVTLMSAPATMAGAMRGSTTCRMARAGLAPRSAAAHSRLRSKPCRRADTISTTNGMVNTMWHMTTVQNERSTSRARRKKMSRAIPMRAPGSMMGKVNRMRAAPAGREALRPRGGGGLGAVGGGGGGGPAAGEKAAPHEGEGGHGADERGQRRCHGRELDRRPDGLHEDAVGEHLLVPVQRRSSEGQPRRPRFPEREEHHEGDGQVEEAEHDACPAAQERSQRARHPADRHQLERIDPFSHEPPRPRRAGSVGRSPAPRSRSRR